MLRRGEVWRIEGARERLGLVISSDVYNSTDVPIVIVVEVVEESLLRDSPLAVSMGRYVVMPDRHLLAHEEVVHRLRGRRRHRHHAPGRPRAAHPPTALSTDLTTAARPWCGPRFRPDPRRALPGNRTFLAFLLVTSTRRSRREHAHQHRSHHPSHRLPPGVRAGCDDWRPEDPDFWRATGAPIARRNLWVSIFAEHVGFSVWSLWSVTVLFLGPAYGIDPAGKFLLTAVPAALGGGAAAAVHAGGGPLRRADAGRSSARCCCWCRRCR